MNNFFEDLKERLEDAIASEKGKKTLRSHNVEIPEKPSVYTEKEIRKIRDSGNYSQSVFALVLNVSVKTIQAWERLSQILMHPTWVKTHPKCTSTMTCRHYLPFAFMAISVCHGAALYVVSYRLLEL
jgi:DNA-binding transcriptional regulator YiaG